MVSITRSVVYFYSTSSLYSLYKSLCYVRLLMTFACLTLMPTTVVAEGRCIWISSISKAYHYYSTFHRCRVPLSHLHLKKTGINVLCESYAVMQYFMLQSPFDLLPIQLNQIIPLSYAVILFMPPVAYVNKPVSSTLYYFGHWKRLNECVKSFAE